MISRALSRWWRNHGTLRVLYLLFLCQLVSFGVALSSFFSSLIAKLGVDSPLTETLFVYLALVLVYGSILLYRRQKPQVSWRWYLLLGFVDVQGNYLFNKAFQFTSLTSVTLLDCWTVAWAIILTRIFIGTRYSLWQLFGAAVCLLGLVLVLLSDARVDSGGGSRPLLGDTLVIAATIFYAMSNVGEILALAAFVLSGLIVYTLSALILKMSGATLFNLSILTSDMWAVVFRIFLYHQQVNWLYHLAFASAVIGLVIYNANENEHVPEPALDDESHYMQYQVLAVENMQHPETKSLTS